jgi:hypothetical protein
MQRIIPQEQEQRQAENVMILISAYLVGRRVIKQLFILRAKARNRAANNSRRGRGDEN